MHPVWVAEINVTACNSVKRMAGVTKDENNGYVVFKEINSDM
jgi:hypothetical protein